MTEPWFNPNYAWIAPTLLGATCGIFGGIAGFLIPRGKGKGLVVGLYWMFLGASVLMLLTGIAAYFAGQPYGVWYGLGLGGLVGTGVLGGNYWTFKNGYLQAERRRMQAANLE